MAAVPTTKYLTVLESVDEVLRCENLLYSNDENSPLVWHIYPNVGYLVNPEINLNLQFQVKRIKKGTFCQQNYGFACYSTVFILPNEH